MSHVTRDMSQVLPMTQKNGTCDIKRRKVGVGYGMLEVGVRYGVRYA